MTAERDAAASTTAAAPEQRHPALTPSDARFVVVRLGDAEFALPIGSVRQVLRTPRITRVPRPRPAVIGLFSLRGSVLPALDFGRLIGQAPAERMGSVVVIRTPVGGEGVGLLVDAVTGLVGSEEGEMLPVPAEVHASLPPGWVAGTLALHDRVITLLDPDALLTEQTSQHRAAAAAGTDLAKETG